MEKFKTNISEFTTDEFKKSQKDMMQSTLFGPVNIPANEYVSMLSSKGARLLSKSEQYARQRKAYELLHTKETARLSLQAGQNFGILCRHFEGWYIKSIIIAYLKLSGINAEYEKMHEKGLGFTGYLIKRK